MGVLDDLKRARDAYERREWVTAFQAMSGLDDPALAVEDLMALASTAYVLGQRNDSVLALQRAYRAAADRGNVPAAVRAAYWLTLILGQLGETAVGNGWLARGRRALDELGEAGDIVERGYLQERIAMAHVMQGEFAEAAAAAPVVTEYGRRFHDPDLIAMGLHMEGRMAIYAGRVAAGVALLDEAMTSVLAGEVSPIYAGIVFCSAIEACQEISDLGRVGEWTHALATWCAAQPGLVAFTGQCSVHRGQLMRLHGAFDDAVHELERAADRYSLISGGDPAVGQAHYERGEVLRLKGAYPEAEAAFADAAEHGHPVQPGRAMLLFDRRRHEAAISAVHGLLAELHDPVRRSQVLGAAVTVLAGSDEINEAAPLAEELSAIGAAFACTALKAAAAYATATVALARSDAETALAAGRRGVEIWAQLSAPYEVARNRVVVGSALCLLGDQESGTVELAMARRAFGEMGAVPAERDVGQLLGSDESPGGLSPRELEVLRLVAAGRSNREIAAALVLSEKTVARHLSNIFAKLDVVSRTAAVAFAHEHALV